MKKRKYQAWKGDYANAFFANYDRGIWVDVFYFKYLWLKLNKYIVRTL